MIEYANNNDQKGADMPRMAAAERRAKLIDAARRVIARDGVTAATTRAVAAEAQMPLASFHYVFDSQIELMRELIHVFAEEEAQALGEIAFDPEDPSGAVESFLNGYLDHVIDKAGSQLAVFELAHYALRTPGLEPLAATRVDAARAMVLTVVNRFEEAYGPLQADVDALAQLTVVLGDGLATTLLCERDEARARAVVGLIAPKVEELAFGARLSSR
ncbi:TetR/AcrR family transcriptional regulator [Mariniluteicoccus endophyticus]